MISNRSGRTVARQDRSAAVGERKNDTVMDCAHGDSAKATWATYGTVTTVERLSVRAAYAPLLAPVCASKPADMTSVGMELRVMLRMDGGAGGTFHARQSACRNGSCGALASTA